MKHVRPLPEKDFVETMASWPIVRWTVPRLGIAYAWALPFLTMCRHFQRPAYQSGSFWQFSVHMGLSTLSPRTQPPGRTGLWSRKPTRRQFIFAALLRRTFAQQFPVAALADCWRLRSVVVGGSGDSSYLNPSEPNLQKSKWKKIPEGKRL